MAITIVSRLGTFLTEIQLRPIIKRSDFVDHIGARIVRTRWIGTAPSKSRPLAPPDVRTLEALLTNDLAALLHRANSACDSILDSVSARADDLGIRLSRDMLSERIATRVGAAHASEEPDPATSETTAGEILASLLAVAMRPAKFGREEFAQRYAAPYEQAWARHGCASVTAWPPSDVGLGLDRRPHLVAVKAKHARADWSLGTNRDIYGRYALHFDGRAVIKPPDCSRAECGSPVASSPDDPATAEVERACLPYGLSHEAHRVLLRSVAAGLEVEPSRPRGWIRWEDWADPCRPLATDQAIDADVVDAVASYLAAWIHGTSGFQLVNQYGIGELLRPLRFTAVRKAWMIAHGTERRYPEPMRRCAVPRFLRPAFHSAFPGGTYRDWLDGHRGDPLPGEMLDPCPQGSPPEGTSEPAAKSRTGRPPTFEEWTQAGREARTIELLSAHVDVVRSLLGNGSPGRDAYAALVASDPDAYLDVDGAIAFLEEQTGRMD